MQIKCKKLFCYYLHEIYCTSRNIRRSSVEAYIIKQSYLIELPDDSMKVQYNEFKWNVAQTDEIRIYLSLHELACSTPKNIFVSEKEKMIFSHFCSVKQTSISVLSTKIYKQWFDNVSMSDTLCQLLKISENDETEVIIQKISDFRKIVESIIEDKEYNWWINMIMSRIYLFVQFKQNNQSI